MKIKKLLTLLLAVLLCFSALALPPAAYGADVSVDKDCVKVLLVGNSYTYYNGYGEMLSKLGALSGKSLLVVRATKGDSDSLQLLKSNLEYKAWYNGTELTSGSGKTLAEIAALDFGGISRADQWNAVFSQNNADGSLTAGDLAMYRFFADKLPSSKAFVLHDSYVSSSVGNSKRKEHDKAIAQCGCSVMDTRSIFAAYPAACGISDWKTDLTYRDDSYHPTPRAAYLFALATYAKLFGADKFSATPSDTDNCLPLYNSDGGKANEFITDKYKVKSTSAAAMTVTRADAAKLQSLVRSRFLDCIGETVLTETIIVPASPGFNGSINTLNLYTGALTPVPIPAPYYVALSPAAFTYTGGAFTPAVTVYNNVGGVIAPEHYTVFYSKNTQIGKATATVAFRGKYFAGSLSASFDILPQKVRITKKKKLKNGFTLQWAKPDVAVSGYQIQYATNPSFTKAKKVTVKNQKTLTRTVTKLKKNTVYYVRLRVYKKVGGKNYYSEWTKTKKIRTK